MGRRSEKEFKPNIVVKEEKLIFEFLEIIFVGIVALMIAVFIRTEVTMPRGVDGISMQPTYNNYAEYKSGTYDTVRITHLGKIKRGDIIVFEAVGVKDFEGNSSYLIKRVIGVGGDFIEFRKVDGTVEVYRNDVKLNEDYIKKKADGSGMPQFTDKCMGNCEYNKKYEVKKNYYFVMGDNRDNSTDSRSSKVGLVHTSKVEGKVYLYVPYGDNYIAALWRKVFG